MNWILVKRVDQAAGTTFANGDGTVRSWNPPSPGHWECRPAGTAGPYELVAISGGFVAYNPSGNDPVVFGYMPAAPNAPGFGLMTEAPLS
jgi:hypothetical protein